MTEKATSSLQQQIDSSRSAIRSTCTMLSDLVYNWVILNLPEEWRPLVHNIHWTENYEKFYEVSNHGQVRRSSPGRRTYPGLILSPNHTSKYLVVNLHTASRRTTVPIHQLVTTAFIPKTSESNQVNHIYGIVGHNTSLHLEWVTAKENIQRGILTGLKSPRKGGRAVLNWDIAFEIKERHRLGKSVRDLAREFSVSRQSIHYIISGRTWDPKEIIELQSKRITYFSHLIERTFDIINSKPKVKV